ncbi:MAG: homoserine kinase [Alphaproteobacteria bacterium]
MAVYTHVDRPQIEELAARYDLGAVLHVQPIAEGVSNTNYRLDLEAGPHVLTLFEAATDASALPFITEFVDHLAADGIPCPAQRRDRQGQALQQLAGRSALLVEFLQGEWPRQPSDKQLAQIGAWLARLHVSGLSFPGPVPDNVMGLSSWQRIADRCAPLADEVAEGLAEELAEDLADLSEGWAHLPAGPVHLDLFPDNTLFQGDSLTAIIDYCYAAHEALAYDLAIVLNAWCADGEGRFDVGQAGTVLDAYQSIRPLGSDEQAALPLLLRAAALRFALTRLRDWLFPPDHALVTAKDPLPMISLLRTHRTGDMARTLLSGMSS